MQGIATLYVKAIDTAKENPTLSNQEKSLLNKFKIIMLSGSLDDVDREMTQLGMVKRSTLHSVRELAESIYEDWVRSLSIDEEEREQMLEEGKRRADVAETLLSDNLKMQGLLEYSFPRVLKLC